MSKISKMDDNIALKGIELPPELEYEKEGLSEFEEGWNGCLKEIKSKLTELPPELGEEGGVSEFEEGWNACLEEIRKRAKKKPDFKTEKDDVLYFNEKGKLLLWEHCAAQIKKNLGE